MDQWGSQDQKKSLEFVSEQVPENKCMRPLFCTEMIAFQSHMTPVPEIIVCY